VRRLASPLTVPEIHQRARLERDQEITMNPLVV
jgi:hypothetical protein